jgi:hypothetical protein
MQIEFEYTDTYGGESNYSWVKREDFTLPDNLTDLAIVRRAKKWAGINGEPCRVENYGDDIAIYPRHSCTVLFINFIY